jgi:shikimate dehydrogenase
MKITTETKLYGIIGHPTKHSISPSIHNSLFDYFHINAVYVAFDVEPYMLKHTVNGLKALKIQGCNITLPHKEKIIKYIDEVDKQARIIGAVNTIKLEQGKIKGYNTDSRGFLTSLKKYVPDIRGKKIAVIGAGGAAKAVVYALLKENAFVRVFNRTYEKAVKLKEKFKNIEVYPLSQKEILENAEIVINATSCGLNKDDEMLFSPSILKKDAVFYELIYNETPLQHEAKREGIKTIDGKDMLIEQALISFYIWTGKRASSHQLGEII